MDETEQQVAERHRRRLALIWEVALMQVKLLAGGMRDFALIPISIGAALLGLFTGADEPELHFRKVQRFWRRTEEWINLLGESEVGDTADNLAQPLQKTLEAEFERGGWLRKTADHVNTVLDSVNAKTRRTTSAAAAEPRPPDPEPK